MKVGEGYGGYPVESMMNVAPEEDERQPVDSYCHAPDLRVTFQVFLWKTDHSRLSRYYLLMFWLLIDDGAMFGAI